MGRLTNILGALFLSAALWASPASAQAPPPATPVSIDQLYAIPSMIGTAPQRPVWSPDKKQIAFLWNDQGRRFRDVWLYSTVTAKKQRVTARASEFADDAWDEGISEVAWLAGPARFAYVLRGALFVVGADGHSIPVLPERHHVHELSLSPDERYLAFVEGGNPGVNAQMVLPGGALWIVDARHPEEQRASALVPGGERTYVGEYRWSESGKLIAFVRTDASRVRQYDLHYQLDGTDQVEHLTRPFPGDSTPRHTIGVVAPADGAIHWMPRANESDPVWDLSLSHNGESLLVDQSDFLIKHRQVLIYAVATATSREFLSEDDPTRTRADWQAGWAPDGKGIIVLSDRGGYSQLFAISGEGTTPRQITSGPWDVSSFQVDAAHRYIYFVANESQVAERQYYRVPVSGGRIERLSGVPGTHEPVYSADFRFAADLFSSDDTPFDLYLTALDGKRKAVPVTKSPLPAFDDQHWAKVEYVSFKSHVDGALLFGRVVLPLGYDPSRRYPLIVGSVYRDTLRNQWGGRTAHPSWGFDQALASRGYMVLTVGIRSSSGQGRAHAQGLKAYGSIDIEDLESGVRFLTQQGRIDPARVGIWGSSYGGLLTLMSLFKKPDVYAVGVAGAPASNVWHAEPEQQRVMGEPAGADYPGRYERQSAFTMTANLRKPLMIIHGTKDRTVLYADTLALQQRFIEEGKDMVEIVPLPGSDHPWDQHSLAQTRFAYQKMINFFDRYLQPVK